MTSALTSDVWITIPTTIYGTIVAQDVRELRYACAAYSENVRAYKQNSYSASEYLPPSSAKQINGHARNW